MTPSERTDTERLDWMERRGGECQLFGGDHVDDLVLDACWRTTVCSWITRRSLREAIDIAMTKEATP